MPHFPAPLLFPRASGYPLLPAPVLKVVAMGDLQVIEAAVSSNQKLSAHCGRMTLSRLSSNLSFPYTYLAVSPFMGTAGETGVAADAVACRFFAAADFGFLFAILAGHNQWNRGVFRRLYTRAPPARDKSRETRCGQYQGEANFDQVSRIFDLVNAGPIVPLLSFFSA